MKNHRNRLQNLTLVSDFNFRVDVDHATSPQIKKNTFLPFSTYKELIQFKTHQHNLLLLWELNRILRFGRKSAWTVRKSRKLVYWQNASVMCEGRILGPCVMLVDVIVDRRCCSENVWPTEFDIEQIEPTYRRSGFYLGDHRSREMKMLFI
jgi:hypothetical protein